MIDPALARRIKLVGLDVDGVLTDGGIYLGAVDGAPLEFKRYDIQDGIGVRFLRAAGIVVVIVTGRVSESVRMRGAELDVDQVIQDPHARKLPALREVVEQRGLSLDECAFVGDDYPDLAVLREVALPVAVANAVPEVAATASLRLTRSGGYGAVREFAEALLTARGDWGRLVEEYVASRSESPAGSGT